MSASMMAMSAELEIFLRLGAAALIGAMIGLNRDLHGKPTGVRTLGLVGLGAALVVLASMDFNTGTASDPNPVSRAIQGVLTGIGFLGAGVIVRDSKGTRVQGLTTAALIWLTACLGIVCGLGAWTVAFVSLFFILALLGIGGPFEHWLHRKWGRDRGQAGHSKGVGDEP
jgi:putative Mg2+ transporter-C (MgtC) family protein